MSSRFSVVHASAALDTRLSLRDLSVLLVLGSHADRSGHCYPSTRRIGDMLGVTRQAVQRSLNHLADIGYVKKKARYRDDGGQSSNEYWVVMDLEVDEEYIRASCVAHVAGGQPQKLQGGQPQEVAGGATPEVAGGATSEVAPYNKPNEQTQLTTSGEERRARARPPLPRWVNPTAWAEFEQHRKDIRKPLTDLARTKAWNQLKGLTPEQQQEVIDYSIAGRYQGLFPDRLNNTKTGGKSSMIERNIDNMRKAGLL